MTCKPYTAHTRYNNVPTDKVPERVRSVCFLEVYFPIRNDFPISTVHVLTLTKYYKLNVCFI
jgi:hypothetical protein